MNFIEFKKLCKPLHIQVNCKFGPGFLVSAPTSEEVFIKLEPRNFEVSYIGWCYNYNSNKRLCILYVERKK